MTLDGEGVGRPVYRVGAPTGDEVRSPARAYLSSKWVKSGSPSDGRCRSNPEEVRYAGNPAADADRAPAPAGPQRLSAPFRGDAAPIRANAEREIDEREHKDRPERDPFPAFGEDRLHPESERDASETR